MQCGSEVEIQSAIDIIAVNELRSHSYPLVPTSGLLVVLLAGCSLSGVK